MSNIDILGWMEKHKLLTGRQIFDNRASFFGPPNVYIWSYLDLIVGMSSNEEV